MEQGKDETTVQYCVKMVNPQIVKDNLHPLLGSTAIQNMGLVSMKEKFQMVARVTQGEELNIHMPVSPYNNKVNGKVESVVKWVKNLLWKAKVTILDH